jgi:NitT/TauT family transport system ATP-binding protein
LDIPKVHYSVLLGFLEVLDDLGGKSDVAGIASKQGLELDYLLPILESGEMLGFIQVESGDVSITEKGHLFIAASPKVRKKILRDIIIQFETYRKIVNLIKQNENGHIRKYELLEFISTNDATTAANNDELSDFDWIIEWGREALILNYNANTENISLRQGNLSMLHS